VHLYRPSAAGLDRQLALELDAAGVQALDASGLEPGLWRVKVTWSVGGQQYYFDQKVVISPPKS
jgi:nitrogen fixation protein FixH